MSSYFAGLEQENEERYAYRIDRLYLYYMNAFFADMPKSETAEGKDQRCMAITKLVKAHLLVEQNEILRNLHLGAVPKTGSWLE